MEIEPDHKSRLKALFQDLAQRYTDDLLLVESLWKEIETNYSGKSRHYHNLLHLSGLLEQLTEVKADIEDWDVMLFSLFYHDLVYNPMKRDNEEKSGRLAKKRLMTLGVSDKESEKCFIQILATKAHMKSNNNDTNLFTDADLSILGYDSNRYADYCRQVRKEYHIYPDMLYKPARKKVLMHFLSMDRIFKTDHFYRKFENQARQNLANELKDL